MGREQHNQITKLVSSRARSLVNRKQNKMSNVIKFPTREAAKAAATATQLVFTMYSTEMEEVAIHVVDSSPIGVLSVVRHK